MMSKSTRECPRLRIEDDEGRPIRLLMAALVAFVIVLLFAATFLIPPADAVEGAIVVTQAWSRATPGGSKVAGGYLMIENKGPAPDKLLSASTDVAKKVEIHEMAVNDGVMTMRPVEGGLPIEPGQTVKFAPGGLHLMIVGLSAPLVQGDKVPVTLKFEKAGEITVSFDVQPMGAPAPGPLSNVANPVVHSTAKM
jgi:periplasmic copper chaperone A